MGCEYRYNPNRVNWTYEHTFASLRTISTGFNYQASIINGEDHYRRRWEQGQFVRWVTPDPPALSAPYYLDLDFVRETHSDPGQPDRHLLAQFMFQKHSPLASEAVIAIHGSSVAPNDWSSSEFYLNNGRASLYNAGYDVFMPYVTHAARFNDAMTRIAGAYGEEGHAIDLMRVLAVFAHVKALGYSKVHLVGVSYGGQLAAWAANWLATDGALGCALCIEGWFPSAIHIEDDSQAQEFWPGWQCAFPGIQLDEFLDLPPNTYVAHGSCPFGVTLADLYEALPSERVISYTGGHEFIFSAFQEAVSRNSG